MGLALTLPDRQPPSTVKAQGVMVTRQELHELFEAIPDSGLEDAGRYLAALKQAYGDPFLAHLLLAPEDDEPDTDEERAGADEAWQEYLRGETVSADEIKRRYGLR